MFRVVALEVKLQRELHKAWIPRPLHAAEVGSVRSISIGLEKLCVVECVKEFATKIDSIPFADRRALYESKLPIIDSRATADRPRRIANRSWLNRVFRERVRIESGVDQCAGRRIRTGSRGTSELAWIDGVERRANIGLSWCFKVEA